MCDGKLNKDKRRDQVCELIIEKGLGYPGRMISGSKSGYLDGHKGNIVIFNGNIITESAGKVWFGDMDVTKDAAILKEVAREIGEDLYLLHEHDARFENEDLPFEKHARMARCIIKCSEDPDTLKTTDQYLNSKY